MKVKPWVAASLWGAIIIAASSIPLFGSLGAGGRGTDKLVHFCEYLILGYLVYRAVPAGEPWERRAALLTLLMCGVWAIVDEAHQALVPVRSPEVTDLLADVAGAAVGIGVRKFRQGLVDRLS